ncbi:hypothetical protein, partial [Dethiothermospora halolimnae]|uniref:hypothetical protein n=1 Tax=Dethiothermospora halolimnae TaxID=3114390 RepID=UPI003CCB7AC6
MKNKQFKNVLIILLIFQMFFSPLLNVKAHDAVYIQITIDERNNKYMSHLNSDKPGYLKEGNHQEAQTGYFGDYRAKEKEPLDVFDLSSNLDNFKDIELEGDDAHGVSETGEVDDGLIFTFPAKEENKYLIAGAYNAGAQDQERAFQISSTLTSSLNSMLAMVNDGKKYQDTDDLIRASIYIRPSADTGGFKEAKLPSKQGSIYHIMYGTDPTKTPSTITEEFPDSNFDKQNLGKYKPHADENGNLYAYVWKEVDGQSNQVNVKSITPFIYAMPKGYIPIDGINNGEALIEKSEGTNFEFADSGNDTAWLTIHHLAFQANHSRTNMGMHYGNIDTKFESDTGWFEDKIYGLLFSVFSGIRTLLGLYETQELIYNEGMRGTDLYNDGMMS